MKKLIILLTLVLFTNVNVALAEDPVDFPDENLEAAVRLELGIPEPDPIYPSDMLLLTYLNANRRDIISLVGLQWSAPVCCTSCYESISHAFSLP